MSIEDNTEKIKGLDGEEELMEEFDIVPAGKSSVQLERPILYVAILLLTALLSFGLGQLSTMSNNSGGIKISNPILDQSQSRKISTQFTEEGITLKTEGKVLASKNGTKYYYPNCSGVKRILPENIIWFSSEKDAQSSGRALSVGCTPGN